MHGIFLEMLAGGHSFLELFLCSIPNHRTPVSYQTTFYRFPYIIFGACVFMASASIHSFLELFYYSTPNRQTPIIYEIILHVYNLKLEDLIGSIISYLRSIKVMNTVFSVVHQFLLVTRKSNWL